MSDDPHHAHLIQEVAGLYEPILASSPQAVYIYLDDTHKICNQKLADLLGYKSIEDWVAYEAPLADIVESDQNRVVEAYAKASEDMEASTLKVAAITKDGSEIHLNIIMVPFSYENEVFVVHFISEK